MKNKIFYRICKIGGTFCLAALAPSTGWACACGCGVFDVATSSMFPTGAGGMVFLNYDYQDQNQNWSGTSSAPASHNDDKEIKTDFFSLDLQYFFNYSWGIQAELPYDYRSFTTKIGPGNIVTRNWSQFGDLRIEGVYTGFFPDLSAGVDLGVKLPTGSHTFDSRIVDRDTELGSGSTDILLGGFYRNSLTKDGKWDWFAQAELDLPVLTQVEYRPGLELDTAAGIYYRGWWLGRVKISPIAQIIFSERTSDSGANASGGANDDPAGGVNSGYQRIMLSPGIEFHIHSVKVYADAEFPVFQNFIGNQVVAPVLLKVNLGWAF